MSAITAALSQIDRVAAEGDLVPEAAAPLELEMASEPIVLPDGKRIYPPCLHGQPIDELALALLDMNDPAAVELPAADRPARRRQEPDRPRDRLPPVDRPRPRGRRPARRSVLRVRRAPAGPVVGRVLLPLRLRPVAGGGGQVALVDSAFVQAMREGWVVMIDEVNTARDVALLVDQRHPRRPPHACTSLRPVRPSSPAGVRGPARLRPGAGRRDRHPRRVALAVPRDARGHVQLGRRSRSSARQQSLVAEAMRARPPADRRRGAGSDRRRSSATSSRCGG